MRSRVLNWTRLVQLVAWRVLRLWSVIRRAWAWCVVCVVLVELATFVAAQRCDGASCRYATVFAALRRAEFRASHGCGHCLRSVTPWRAFRVFARRDSGRLGGMVPSPRPGGRPRDGRSADCLLYGVLSSSRCTPSAVVDIAAGVHTPKGARTPRSSDCADIIGQFHPSDIVKTITDYGSSPHRHFVKSFRRTS